MSSMEVNVDMLEHMDLMDISDQEALDVFLNSGGEEGSVQSPVTGTQGHHNAACPPKGSHPQPAPVHLKPV